MNDSQDHDQGSCDICSRKLRGVYTKYYPELSIEDCKDVCQESSLIMLTLQREQPERYRKIRNPCAYGWRVAIRLALAKLEQSKRILMCDPYILNQDRDTYSETDDFFNELAILLPSAVAELPEQYRRVIVAYYCLLSKDPEEWYGSTIERTAQTLQLTEGQVRGYLHRGTQLLRRQFEEYLELEPGQLSKRKNNHGRNPEAEDT